MERPRMSPTGIHAALLVAFGSLALPAGSAAQTVAARTAKDQVQVVCVELDPYGFRPSTVLVKPGKYILIVRNYTARKNVDFRFQTSGGTLVKAQSLNDRKPRFSATVELPSGEYSLTAQHDKTHTLKIVAR